MMEKQLTRSAIIRNSEKSEKINTLSLGCFFSILTRYWSLAQFLIKLKYWLCNQQPRIKCPIKLCWQCCCISCVVHRYDISQSLSRVASDGRLLQDRHIRPLSNTAFASGPDGLVGCSRIQALFVWFLSQVSCWDRRSARALLANWLAVGSTNRSHRLQRPLIFEPPIWAFMASKNSLTTFGSIHERRLRSLGKQVPLSREF